MQNYNIDSICRAIESYNIELKRTELNNNKSENKHIDKIKVAIDVKNSEILTEKDSKYIMMSVSIYGLDFEYDENSLENIKEDSIFYMQCVYKISICTDMKLDKKEYANVAWLLLYPTLNSAISFYCNQLKIPSICVPYRAED